MSAQDLYYFICFALMAATGAYMMAAPRRLFMREDDPAEYRPEAVEYDSEQGRWLRKVAGPLFLIAGLALIAFRLL